MLTKTGGGLQDIKDVCFKVNNMLANIHVTISQNFILDDLDEAEYTYLLLPLPTPHQLISLTLGGFDIESGVGFIARAENRILTIECSYITPIIYARQSLHIIFGKEWMPFGKMIHFEMKFKWHTPILQIFGSPPFNQFVLSEIHRNEFARDISFLNQFPHNDLHLNIRVTHMDTNYALFDLERKELQVCLMPNSLCHPQEIINNQLSLVLFLDSRFGQSKHLTHVQLAVQCLLHSLPPLSKINFIMVSLDGRYRRLFPHLIVYSDVALEAIRIEIEDLGTDMEDNYFFETFEQCIETKSVLSPPEILFITSTLSPCYLKTSSNTIPFSVLLLVDEKQHFTSHWEKIVTFGELSVVMNPDDMMEAGVEMLKRFLSYPTFDQVSIEKVDISNFASSTTSLSTLNRDIVHVGCSVLTGGFHKKKEIRLDYRSGHEIFVQHIPLYHFDSKSSPSFKNNNNSFSSSSSACYSLYPYFVSEIVNTKISSIVSYSFYRIISSQSIHGIWKSNSFLEKIFPDKNNRDLTISILKYLETIPASFLQIIKQKGYNSLT